MPVSPLERKAHRTRACPSSPSRARRARLVGFEHGGASWAPSKETPVLSKGSRKRVVLDRGHGGPRPRTRARKRAILKRAIARAGAVGDQPRRAHRRWRRRWGSRRKKWRRRLASATRRRAEDAFGRSEAAGVDGRRRREPRPRDSPVLAAGGDVRGPEPVLLRDERADALLLAGSWAVLGMGLSLSNPEGLHSASTTHASRALSRMSERRRRAT